MTILSETLHQRDGKDVKLFHFTNANRMKVSISNYGGVIQSIICQDKHGQEADVALGFDDFSDYYDKSPHFGCITGRYANRIANGQFSINGQSYQLALNNGPNHLHGGPKALDKKVWDAEVSADKLILTYLSPDGEENYPGNLDCKVTYELSDDNEIIMEYFAKSDKDTVVNLTNHSYFNLKGAGNGDVLDHMLQINAKHITPVNVNLIPTGEFVDIRGTAFDFTSFQRIGDDINDTHEQLKLANGYDHNFVLNHNNKDFIEAATVYEETSGRSLTVYTSEPGVQLYTANFLDGSLIGKGNKVYHQRYAFCLETQHYPDSPNQKSFPTTLLKAGENYNTKTIYKFGLI